MSPEHTSILRDKLTAACDAHISNGGKIVDKFFSRKEEEQEYCCPMFCLSGNMGGGIEFGLNQVLPFEITYNEVWSFIHSFDNDKSTLSVWKSEGYLNQPMADLGAELRAKYILPPETSGA